MNCKTTAHGDYGLTKLNYKDLKKYLRNNFGDNFNITYKGDHITIDVYNIPQDESTKLLNHVSFKVTEYIQSVNNPTKTFAIINYLI